MMTASRLLKQRSRSSDDLKPGTKSKHDSSDVGFDYYEMLMATARAGAADREADWCQERSGRLT